jgi:hypothetical protein
MHYMRRQDTVDDLFVEYNAWVNNIVDAHDLAVRDFKARAWEPDIVHPRLAKYDPALPFAAPFGNCDCLANNVKAQLTAEHTSRLLEARERRAAWERQERYFEKRLRELGG